MSVQTAHGINHNIHLLGEYSSQQLLVVFIHGLITANSANFYLSLAPGFARQHRVLLYDIRGHGKSEPARTGYTLEQLSADLASLIEHCKAQQIYLVGHSYGGLIALHYALAHTKHVQRLTLIDVPRQPRDILPGLMAYRDHTEAFKQHLFDHWIRVVQGPLRREKNIWERLTFLLDQTSLLNDVSHEPNIDTARLKQLQIPVQLIYGTRSIFADVHSYYQTIWPAADVVLLDTKHAVHIEKPVQVFHEMNRFLHG